MYLCRGDVASKKTGAGAMTKKRVGFVLNAMAVAAITVPTLVSAVGNPLPPEPRPCVSTPNSTRHCPPTKVPSVPVKAPVGK
jgi:hypothetical protein